VIKECGHFTWYIHDDGKVRFYSIDGQKAKEMTLKKFMKWMERFSAR
jgi:hypothetical protein